MSVPPAFPNLAGQGWSVHKKPSFSTRVAAHISGREVRTPLYAWPLYEFELTFDGLDSDGTYAGLGAQSLQSLMGLYLQCQGQYGTFLYSDPTDNSATGQAFGVGDGATVNFIFARTLGGFTDPVGFVTNVDAVYLSGTPISTGWSLTQPNILTFATAPGVGAAISADFTYCFVCRFLDDQEDFEEFMNGLWQVSSLKFRSVKP